MANKLREKVKPVVEVVETIVEETVAAQPSKPGKPRKKGVLAKGLSSVFSGTFLSSDKSLKHLPFILYLGFVAVLYIGYNYYADDHIRKENKLAKEIKEFHSEYISTKSDLMFASKQSEVAKASESIGLKQPVVPPTKIQVDSTQLYTSNK